MVNVRDTNLKNIGFNTSVDTGTRTKGGEALAGLVAGAIGVKKAIDSSNIEKERLDKQSSTLMFNDLKIGYQESLNAHEFIDRDNPTSEEWNGFLTKVRQEQNDVYGMLIKEHQQAYDLFHAGQDGKTIEYQNKEFQTTAQNLLNQTAMNASTVEEVKKFHEDGLKRGSVEDSLKNYTDIVEGYLDSGVLKGKTSKEIIEKFPLLKDIKNPKIGAKIRKHILNLEISESVATGVNDGKSIDVLARENGITRQKALEITTKEINTLIGSNDPKKFEKGIEIANHHGIRVKALDLLPEKIMGTIQTAPESAVKFYKQFNDTKDVYNYSKKTEKKLDEFRIVSSMYGLDIGSAEGMQSAAHLIEEANRPDAPKFKVPTDDEIVDAFDPIGPNFMSNMRDDEFAYIAPRVRELMKFTGGDIDKAMGVAINEWDSFDNNAGSSITGSVAGIFNETPYGMFAKDRDELQLALQQFSPTTDADDVEISYFGGDKWAIAYTDDDGKEHIAYKSAKELKAAIKERRKFTESLETLDAVVSKKKFGDTLKDKQIKSDVKEVKKVIEEQTKVIEEKIGEKLDSVQKEELKKRVVESLKEQVRKEDQKSRGLGTGEIFSFSEAVETAYIFVSDLVDKHNKLVGNKKQEGYGKRPDGTEKGSGWLGELKMKDGSGMIMTEYSMGVEIDGKEVLIPSIVPTLNEKEIDHLLNGGDVTDSIVEKAVSHARDRIKKGLSPFKEDTEKPSTVEKIFEKEEQKVVDTVKEDIEKLSSVEKPIEKPAPTALKDLPTKQFIVPNAEHGKRKKTTTIIYHRTAGSKFNPKDTRATEDGKAGHYTITKDGTTYQQVRHDQVAWHGGRGRDGSNLNLSSIGIEIVGAWHQTGGPDEGYFDELTEPQKKALAILTKSLMAEYNLTTDALVAHGVVGFKKPQEGVEALKYFKQQMNA